MHLCNVSLLLPSMGQTMKMTMGEFARKSGINKATLSRMIKAGKISAERQENGRLLIDPSELDRLADIRFTSNVSYNGTPQQSVTPSETVLQRENELLRELLRDKDKQLDDLRSERDEWRKQAQMLLLTQGQPKEPEKPRRWWHFGKKR
jgi:DNA-binding transcriptional MerR regulator